MSATWFSRRYGQQDQDFKAPNDYCVVCDRRIWFFQKGIRVYSLGNNRAHISCAANYLRDELEARRNSKIS